MNRAWKAEVELIANMVITDLARIETQDPTCICPPALCGHDTVYKLFMLNYLTGEAEWVDFVDSETCHVVEQRLDEIKRGGIKWLI